MVVFREVVLLGRFTPYWIFYGLAIIVLAFVIPAEGRLLQLAQVAGLVVACGFVPVLVTKIYPDRVVVRWFLVQRTEFPLTSALDVVRLPVPRLGRFMNAFTSPLRFWIHWLVPSAERRYVFLEPNAVRLTTAGGQVITIGTKAAAPLMEAVARTVPGRT